MLKSRKFQFLAMLLVSVGSVLLLSSSASAATITVATDANPSDCTLSEAIVNMADDAQTNVDCVETGTYGTNDTIVIPEGTVLLDANLPLLGDDTNTNDLTITGAGMGQTIVDGDGQYSLFYCPPVTCDGITLTIEGLTATAFSGNAILMQSGDLVVNQLEVDGTDSVPPNINSSVGGIQIGSNGYEMALDVTDTYIHSISTDTGSLGVYIAIEGDGSVDIDIDRLTVNDITSSGQGAVGIMVILPFNATPGSATALIRNTTVTDITAGLNQAIGIGAQTIMNGGGNGLIEMTVQNTTIGNISGFNNQFIPIPTSGFHSLTGALEDGDVATNIVDLDNVVIYDAQSDGDPRNCLAVDVTGFASGLGTGSITQNSGGGNISSDDTCTDDVFTDGSDQNNVGSLSSTLGALSDNGGFVPTIPLLEGSLAIDAGVEVSGLSEDARGEARPQGNAYDSGAYESDLVTADLAVTKELVTQGVIKPGDTVEYQITIQNTGPHTISGAGTLLDIFSPGLTYQTTTGLIEDSECMVMDMSTPEAVAMMEMAFSSHTDYQILLCDGVVAVDLESGESITINMFFTAGSNVTTLQNYVGLVWKDGTEVDGSVFELFDPGSDLIDRYANGELTGVTNNFSGATYEAQNDSDELADTGHSMLWVVTAAGVSLSIIGQRVLTRQRSFR